MAKKQTMTFKVQDKYTKKKYKPIKCNVAGAEYNRLQKARNCISKAVSKMGCEEHGTNFEKKRVTVNCAIIEREKREKARSRKRKN